MIVNSPIIELNRAVAIGMAEGAEAALAIIDGLAQKPDLKGYHLLPSVRGDLLYGSAASARRGRRSKRPRRWRTTSANTTYWHAGR